MIFQQNKKNSFFNSFFYINNKGFTLIELIIYIAILTILAAIFVNLFFVISKGKAKSDSKTEVQQNIRQALSQISQEVRKASNIIGVYPQDKLCLTVGTNQTIFKLSSGVLQIISGASTSDCITINGGTTSNLTTNKIIVDSIIFNKILNISPSYNPFPSKASVLIDITASYNSQSPDYQYSQNIKTAVNLKK